MTACTLSNVVIAPPRLIDVPAERCNFPFHLALGGVQDTCLTNLNLAYQSVKQFPLPRHALRPASRGTRHAAWQNPQFCRCTRMKYEGHGNAERTLSQCCCGWKLLASPKHQEEFEWSCHAPGNEDDIQSIHEELGGARASGTIRKLSSIVNLMNSISRYIKSACTC